MKKIVAIGGGEISGWNFKTKDENQELYQTKAIDEEVFKLANKSNPKFLFIGTATRENKTYYNAIRSIYERLGCKVSLLEILNKYINIEEIKNTILSSDIIYIGGGNTKFMLEEWQKINLDKILLEAYNKGIVIAGFSAGAYVCFSYNYELIEGLDIIKAISCVHYNEKSEEKKKKFYEAIKDTNILGIALENGTALEYLEGKYKIIKSIKDAKAYKIGYIKEELIIEELKENIEYELK